MKWISHRCSVAAEPRSRDSLLTSDPPSPVGIGSTAVDGTVEGVRGVDPLPGH